MSTEPLAASTLGRTPAALIGRDAELAAISARFHAEARVVSLVGLAGVGKSRLSLEHVERVTADGERVVVVRVRGLVDRALVVDKLVAALPGRDGLAAGPVEALWERLHGDDVLLVLDDVEAGFDAAPLVDELVAGYPGLRVLATSLRPLGASGEQVLRVLPFDTERPGSSDEMSPAVLIFAQKAVAANAGFSLGPHNQGDVLDICRRVGGLPLAIELAASRCAAIPVAVMARQLARPEGIGLLRDGTLSATDPHASMEQALEWTFQLLSDAERRLVDQLSVFEGSFDLEGALRVAAPDASDTAEMLDRISGLVDVQLVDLDPRDPDNPRFRLPRLVRSHASRRLALSGEDAATRSRHAHYFHARCQRPVDPELLPDILAALDRSVVDGHVDDVLHAAVAAITHPPGAGATQVLQDRVNELVNGLEPRNPDPVLLARALIRSATGSAPAADGQTYAESVADRVRAAVAGARRSGDQHALLESLLLTVRSLPTTMDAASAFAAAAEGLALARELGDDTMTARFELYAAMAAQVRGDVETTTGLGTTALKRARAVGDLNTELHAGLLLHRVPPGLLDEDLALPSLEELLAACERAGESRLGGSVLAALANQALDDGDLDRAARVAYRLQLVAADWRLTEPLAATIPLVTLVVVAAGRGDLEEGIELRSALEKFHSVLVFALTPESLARYEAAGLGLAQRAAPHDLATWQERGAAFSLPEAHERGVAYARSVLAPGFAGAYAPPAAVVTELTPRETEVLVKLASGATNKEIGSTLGMSPKTVMHHSVSIYRKLGVRGRGEATAWAYRSGLTQG